MASVFNRGTKDNPKWYIRIRQPDGKWHAVRSHAQTKTQAQKEAERQQYEIDCGNVGILSTKKKAEVPTVAQLYLRFLDECDVSRARNRDRYRKTQRTVFNARIAPFPIANRKADSLTPNDWSAFVNTLKKEGYANETINSTTKYLRTAFVWADEQGIVSVRLPRASMLMLPTQPSQEHYHRDEVERLVQTGDPLICTALYSGMRFGELLGLRWADIDWKGETIHVQRSFSGPTKSGKTRLIPIHRELLPILHAWQSRCPNTSTGHVFPVSRAHLFVGAKKETKHMATRVRKVFAKAACRADFERPCHAMRHTFASQCEQAGVARGALERILGHSASGNHVTLGYIHTDIRFLKTELDRMSLKPTPSATILPFRSVG